MSAGLIQLESKQNNFCFSVPFSLWPQHVIILSLFTATCLQEIIQQKLKTWPFISITKTQTKIFLLFCDCLFFTDTLLYPVSLFHASSMKRIIKLWKLKPQLFSTLVRMQANLFLLFWDCFSFTHLVLCSVSHAPYSNAIGRLLNPLFYIIFFSIDQSLFSLITLPN